MFIMYTYNCDICVEFHTPLELLLRPRKLCELLVKQKADLFNTFFLDETYIYSWTFLFTIYPNESEYHSHIDMGYFFLCNSLTVSFFVGFLHANSQT